MRSSLLCVFLSLTIQLYYFSGVFAQITFTREWVAGKRGPPQSNIQALNSNPEDSSNDSLGCRSTWPVISYLMELEKLREERCGTVTATVAGANPFKPSTFLRKITERFPKFVVKDDLSPFEDEGTDIRGQKHQSP